MTPQKETKREPRKPGLSNEELLESLCDKLQRLGTYKGPRTPEEIQLVSDSVNLRREVLLRMRKRKAVTRG